MIDHERFVRIITILHRAFGREMDDFAIEAFAMGCEGVPIETIERGVEDAVRTSKWMPSPAQLCGRVSLRKPGLTRCAACGIGLAFGDSLERGYCGPCWRKIGGEEEDHARREAPGQLTAPALCDPKDGIRAKAP